MWCSKEFITPILQHAQQMKPNVLLLVMDTARAKSCSVYDADRRTTPTLEEFSEQSVTYDHAIAPSSWTLPSHAAMFTGQYPTDAGVHSQSMILPPDSDTVASELSQEGYSTGVFSANPFLVAGSNLDHGFSHRRATNSRQVLFRDAFDPAKYIRSRDHETGAAKFQELLSEVSAPPVRFGKNVANALYYKARTTWDVGGLFSGDRPDDGAKESIAAFKSWLERDRNATSPYFACLNFMEPHTPYRIRDTFLPEWASEEDLVDLSQDRWPYLSGELDLSDRHKELFRALYEAEIEYLDQQFAKLFEFLRSTTEWDDTLVIVTSDHGELLGECELLFHDMNRLLEPLVHVPLLIKYPGERFAGKHVDETVSLINLYDTILAETTGNSDGRTPLHPDSTYPDKVKSEFVGMNQTAPREPHLSVYEELSERSCAVYSDQKYILFDDGQAIVTSASDESDDCKGPESVSVPDDILEFSNMNEGTERGDQLETDEDLEQRLEHLGYR